MYWSVVSLTTVGYGDLYPTSDFGRAIAMISSFIGIAIVAMPSGIIAAGLVEALGGESTEDGRNSLVADEDSAKDDRCGSATT